MVNAFGEISYHYEYLLSSPHTHTSIPKNTSREYLSVLDRQALVLVMQHKHDIVLLLLQILKRNLMILQYSKNLLFTKPDMSDNTLLLSTNTNPVTTSRQKHNDSSNLLIFNYQKKITNRLKAIGL